MSKNLPGALASAVIMTLDTGARTFRELVKLTGAGEGPIAAALSECRVEDLTVCRDGVFELTKRGRDLLARCQRGGRQARRQAA
jgi:hypothetical protein